MIRDCDLGHEPVLVFSGPRIARLGLAIADGPQCSRGSGAVWETVVRGGARLIAGALARFTCASQLPTAALIARRTGARLREVSAGAIGK
jgi:hypothetical protein